MLAEFSAECGADDPVVVVPWTDPDGSAAFVDLRNDPDAIDFIPEVEAHPPLLEALRALNAARSPVFTAKCDAWTLSEEECEALLPHLDINPEDAKAGFASYIDLLWRDRAIFASQHRQQQLLHRIVRYAAPLEHPAAMLELVLRPAMVDLEGPQEGFAATLYIKALGADAEEAWQYWADALRSVTALLRSMDLSGAV